LENTPDDLKGWLNGSASLFSASVEATTKIQKIFDLLQFQAA
jgi:hypothetical protein